MAEQNVQLLWVNQASFLASIRDARAKVQDLTPAMKLIAADFFESEKSVFERKDAGPYQDLSAKYKKAKQRKFGFVYPVNRATGALMRSVTNPDDENAVSRITSSTFVVGSKVPYSIFVQRKRPFLFIGTETPYGTNQTKNRVQRWQNILKAFVLQKLKQPAVSGT